MCLSNGFVWIRNLWLCVYVASVASVAFCRLMQKTRADEPHSAPDSIVSILALSYHSFIAILVFCFWIDDLSKRSEMVVSCPFVQFLLAKLSFIAIFLNEIRIFPLLFWSVFCRFFSKLKLLGKISWRANYSNSNAGSNLNSDILLVKTLPCIYFQSSIFRKLNEKLVLSLFYENCYNCMVWHTHTKTNYYTY